MPRTLSIAVLLVCAAPAVAAPQLPVSFGGRVDAARPLHAAPDVRIVPRISGVPGSWDSLLSPAPNLPAEDICDQLGHGKPPDTARVPFDPEQILSKLLDAGLCAEPPG